MKMMNYILSIEIVEQINMKMNVLKCNKNYTPCKSFSSILLNIISRHTEIDTIENKHLKKYF